MSVICVFRSVYLGLRTLRNELTFLWNLFFPTTQTLISAKEELTSEVVKLSHSTAKPWPDPFLATLRLPFLPSSMLAFLRFQPQPSSLLLSPIHLIVSHHFNNGLLMDNPQSCIINVNFLTPKFQTHISNYFLDIFIPLAPQNVIVFNDIFFNSSNGDYLN